MNNVRELFPLQQFESHNREIFSIVKIPGKNMFVTGGLDNSIIFWSDDGAFLFRKRKLPNAVYILFANEMYVGAVCYDEILVFDLEGTLISQILFDKRIMSASFIPFHDLISVGLMSGELCIIDLNGDPLFFETIHESALNSISWVSNQDINSQYGCIFSTVGVDRRINIFSFLFEEIRKYVSIIKIGTIDLKQFGIASVPKKLLFNSSANSLILQTFKSELFQFEFTK